MSAGSDRLWMSLSSSGGWRRVEELATDAGFTRETALRWLRDWASAGEAEVGRPPEHGLALMARPMVRDEDPPDVTRDVVTTYVSRPDAPFVVHVNRQTGEIDRRRRDGLGPEAFAPMPPAGAGLRALWWEPEGRTPAPAPEAETAAPAPPVEGEEEPVQVMRDGERRYWWYGGLASIPLEPGDTVVDREGRPVERPAPDEALIAAGVEAAGRLAAARTPDGGAALAALAAPGEEAPGEEGAGMLARLGEAAGLLIDAQSDFERVRIRDEGRAVEAAARILGRTEVQVEASLLVQAAERAIAQAHPALTPAEAAGRPEGVIRDNTLRPEVIRQIRAAHAPLDDEDYLVLVAEARESGTPLTRRAVRAASRPKVVHNSGEIEWYTPPEVMDLAREVFGREVELDPCSCEVAQRVVQARAWWGVEENGLGRDWRAETLWLNPPYSGAARWVDQVVGEVDAGRVRHALVLTLNSTETEWCQTLLGYASAVAFPHGRIRFLAADGERRKAGIQGQIVTQLLAPDMEYGERTRAVRRFIAAWRLRGRVYGPIGWPEEKDHVQ